MSSSHRLNQVLEQYEVYSPYPDIRELTKLLSDVTDDEKVSIVNSRRALYRAAVCNAEMITTILLSVPQHQRLDVELVTPLENAALFGKSDCVEAILTHLTPEHQLKILSVRDDEGWTPADWASDGGHKKTERLLREYQQRAERQINKYRNKDNNDQGYFLKRELQQTRLKLDNQAKEIQTLTSAVSELDTSNKNKDEILHKITEESKEMKSTVQKLIEKIGKQTAEAARNQTESGQQRDQILKQQSDITELRDELRATGRRQQVDIANQKLHYETILTEQQEQITRQQTQIDLVMSTVTVRNLAMSNLNDRHEVLGTTCTNLREDMDSLTGVVQRIDEQFYPDTNAVGRGPPHDGGDEVVDESLTAPELSTDA